MSVISSIPFSGQRQLKTQQKEIACVLLSDRFFENQQKDDKQFKALGEISGFLFPQEWDSNSR